MSIEDYSPSKACYEHLRRRLSKCGCLDSLRVVWAYSNFLETENFDFPDDIEKPSDLPRNLPDAQFHGWELEIIAREAIIANGDASKTLREWETFAAVTSKRICRLENEIFGEGQMKDIHVEMAVLDHFSHGGPIFGTKTGCFRYRDLVLRHDDSADFDGTLGVF